MSAICDAAVSDPLKALGRAGDERRGDHLDAGKANLLDFRGTSADAAKAAALNAPARVRRGGNDILRALENRHRWLLFAQHCYTCASPEEQCELGKLCTYGKKTLRHVGACTKAPCTYPRCALLKPLLQHSRRCQSSTCAICVPVWNYIQKETSAAGNGTGGGTTAPPLGASGRDTSPPAATPVAPQAPSQDQMRPKSEPRAFTGANGPMVHCQAAASLPTLDKAPPAAAVGLAAPPTSATSSAAPLADAGRAGSADGTPAPTSGGLGVNGRTSSGEGAGGMASGDGGGMRLVKPEPLKPDLVNGGGHVTQQPSTVGMVGLQLAQALAAQNGGQAGPGAPTAGPNGPASAPQRFVGMAAPYGLPPYTAGPGITAAVSAHGPIPSAAAKGVTIAAAPRAAPIPVNASGLQVPAAAVGPGAAHSQPHPGSHPGAPPQAVHLAQSFPPAGSMSAYFSSYHPAHGPHPGAPGSGPGGAAVTGQWLALPSLAAVSGGAGGPGGVPGGAAIWPGAHTIRGPSGAPLTIYGLPPGADPSRPPGMAPPGSHMDPHRFGATYAIASGGHINGQPVFIFPSGPPPGGAAGPGHMATAGHLAAAAQYSRPGAPPQMMPPPPHAVINAPPLFTQPQPGGGGGPDGGAAAAGPGGHGPSAGAPAPGGGGAPEIAAGAPMWSYVLR
ncbi:hypothetical protein HYH03_004349 [Edaphochlamys debaryana]|uniref:histone acetyltransferase n=1 Tax=Edaphochlamys debaryana TaxID=47281 RepID=A0A836C294_9CHLO|nr:hypothetical protein HYH03_004349 [Edaphochlamys debaryana]|eukprot:KAG2497605.1 hypothetical protein HYH03_004349 [Edaphochlamys debaryana]